MKITYQKYLFKLKFEKPIYFKTYPFFTIRSVFGMNLRKTVCILKNYKCSECPVKNVCSYNILFESHVDKEKDIFSGSNRAPHPLLITPKYFVENPINELDVNVVLIGENIKYFPYVYYSFLKSGESGVLKQRFKFEIMDVISRNKKVVKGDKIIIPEKIEELKFNLLKYFNKNGSFKKKVLSGEVQRKVYSIEFLSPVRIKKEGKFIDDIYPKDILISFFRRLQILTYYYGSDFNEDDKTLFNKIIDSIDFYTIKKETKWFDFSYYSSRQKFKMKMGGLIGNIRFEISGKIEFIKLIDKIFDAMNHLNIGKNISFGLGKVKVNEEVKVEEK